MAEADAGDRRDVRARIGDRLAHGDARIELTAGVDRLLQQQPIEIASQNRAAVEAARIRPLNRRAVLPGDEHAVDAQPMRVDRVADAERAQPARARPG